MAWLNLRNCIRFAIIEDKVVVSTKGLLDLMDIVLIDACNEDDAVVAISKLGKEVGGENK